MKWDFETGAGRVDLTKEGGMSQETRVQRGGGLHAGGDQHTATRLQCIVLLAESKVLLGQTKESFEVRKASSRTKRSWPTCWTRTSRPLQVP